MNNLPFLKWMLSISLYLMFYSCSNTEEYTLPCPEIKDGIAKLSGKITTYHPIGEGDKPSLILTVLHPVTAEAYGVTTALNEDGVFTFEFPMQCNYAIGYLYPKMNNYEQFRVCLFSGKETKINILFEKPGRYRIANQTDSLGLTATDLINIEKVSDELFNARPPGITGYAKTPDEFVKRMKIILNDLLEKIVENDDLSEIAKNFVADDVKLLSLGWDFLHYREVMRIDYLNAGNEDVENFNPPDLNKKQYAFLKDFNLNNPQYLYQYQYRYVLQEILSNDTLSILPVGDTPVDQWMKEVKKILSQLVGFDKGLFYDMLAANSYARQFNNELRPLSDKQIENIKDYFKDDKAEIAKILLRKNDEIIQLSAQKEPLVMNETPAVSKEKVMDAIVSKYQGKVVVVDFWATWCAPCLDAMQKYRTIKGALQGKNIVFVYLTNRSSPQKLWKEKIKGIGGEHYYLNDEEWVYIMETFGFQAIPSYVFFDTKGEVRHQCTAYPGNEKMLAMIEELLP